MDFGILSPALQYKIMSFSPMRLEKLGQILFWKSVTMGGKKVKIQDWDHHIPVCVWVSVDCLQFLVAFN